MTPTMTAAVVVLRVVVRRAHNTTNVKVLPIFRDFLCVTKSGFLVFLVGRIPTTRSLRSPDGLYLQIHSGDQAGFEPVTGR